MSRRRDQKREKERDLARQLDPADRELGQALLERPRTGFVSLRALVGETRSRPRTFFRRDSIFILTRVGIRSPDGFRSIFACVHRLAGKDASREDASIVNASDDGIMQVKVTHHRPAHIVIVVTAHTSLPSPKDVQSWPTTISVAGQVLRPDAPELAAHVNDGARVAVVSDVDASRIGAALVVLPAAGLGRRQLAVAIANSAASWDLALELHIDT